MLALPGFDTYGALPRYARNPRKIENQIALALLKRRASKQLVWDVFAAYKPGLDLQALLKLRIGMRNEESAGRAGYVASLLAKPVETEEEEEQRDAIYLDLLKKSGIDVEAVRERLQQVRTK